MIYVLLIFNLLLSIAILYAIASLNTRLTITYLLTCDHVTRENVDLKVDLSTPTARIPLDYFKAEFEEFEQN